MEKYSKIGEVVFSATTSEDVIYENEVTDRPVEDLGYISDHVKQKPIKFSIAGVITGADAFSKLMTLRKYCQGREVYRYSGRNLMANVVIENLSTSHGKEIRNGCSFTMNCKIVRRAHSKEVPLPLPDPAADKKDASGKKTATQTKVSGSKGKMLPSTKPTDSKAKAYMDKKRKEREALRSRMRRKRDYKKQKQMEY